LAHDWLRERITAHAASLLLKERVRFLLAERGESINRFLSKGDTGADVHNTQKLLADLGFFPPEKINGSFGLLTEQSVLAYQLDRGIVESGASIGAGTVGPATLRTLQEEQVRGAVRMVRGHGWDVL
jgi:peptidoglycan hydrolase-like protein with peptidoglycan-binding domain